MLQCDTCQIWMHAFCCGVPPSDEDPATFVCAACSAKAASIEA
jgi:hypothetical protein